MSKGKRSILIDGDVYEAIARHAKDKGSTVKDAAESLILTGVVRKAALAKYAKKSRKAPKKRGADK